MGIYSSSETERTRMKSCLFYFSCGGTCKALSEAIASSMGISSLELLKPKGEFYLTMDKTKIDPKVQMKSTFKQLFGTSIEMVDTKMDDFDVVYIVVPMYMFNMASPMRTFLKDYKDALAGKKVVLVNCSGKNRIESIAKKFKKIVGKEAEKQYGFKESEFLEEDELFVHDFSSMISDLKEDDL